MEEDAHGITILTAREDNLCSRVDLLFKSKGQMDRIEDVIAILGECVKHGDILMCPELSLHKIQALAARIEESTKPIDLPTVEGFVERVLPYLTNEVPMVECRTKQDYQNSLKRCIFSRVIFSVMFTLLNNMSRRTRKAVETMIFTKYAPLMECATNKLFNNLDFEEKISLVELLWRGIRRVGNAKATQAMSSKPCVSFKGIKQLDATIFEKGAIAWLELSGCLDENCGFYKAKGRMELSLSTSGHTMLEQDLTEIVLSPSILRIHLYSSDDQSCLKVEIPFSHMVNISLVDDCLAILFKLSVDRFSIVGLWSVPLQGVIPNNVGPSELLFIKVHFIDPSSRRLVGSIGSIGVIINSEATVNVSLIEKEPSLVDEQQISEAASESGYKRNTTKDQLNYIPSSLMLSSRKKAEALLHYNDSVTTDDYKVMDKVSKRMELNTSPSSSEYQHPSVSFSTEISNSISSCEKPFDDPLLDPSHRTMQLHGPSTVEPLMISLHHYREAKAKEMHSIFKRIYREELEQAMTEVTKLCASQNAKRREVHGSYKKEVEALVKEIEHNHQDLTEQLKKLLNEFDVLKSNNIVKECKKGDASRPCDGGNSLISNCSGLVQSTEVAIKEIDDAIQRIKKHYIKKKYDCSRALEGLYNPKVVDVD